jgi:diguanylate cyclase (GGDEF)-like protein
MLHIDVFTCYVVTGASALAGLGLLALIRSDQPRVQYALGLFRWAMLCLTGMLALWAAPLAIRPEVLKLSIGLAASGVALLAWAFRHLNGGRTHPAAGVSLCFMAACLPWLAGYWGQDVAYVRAVTTVFACTSVFMAIDQGMVTLRQPRAHGTDVILLSAAVLFAGNWLILTGWVWTQPGPYAAYWLHGPEWLLPLTSMGFAVLPMGVAAVVFASINARLHQQLRARALSDDLTGALSRRGLRELGQRMLSFQQGPGGVLAVFMLDLDYFKDVNDRYGHVVGDEVLRHVVQVVREHLREDALVARYGGEEFTVLVPVRSRSEGLLVAERLREVIELSPCECGPTPIRVTVSIGMAIHHEPATLEDDLARADAALYEAKRAGRNRVVASPQHTLPPPLSSLELAQHE